MNIFLGQLEKQSSTTVVAIIPARAGSKGLPNKNILNLGGLPLVEHSIRLALAIGDFSYVVVTSDSPEILALRASYPDVLFLFRPEIISSDASLITDVILHVFDSLDLDLGKEPSFFVLQPTSPFRLPSDISSALAFAAKNNVSSMISVAKMSQNPSECLTLKENGWRLLVSPPLLSFRRQDYLDAYFITGCFYYATLRQLRSRLNKCFLQSSLWQTQEPFVVDIDTPCDFDLATSLFDYMTLQGFTYRSESWELAR